MVLRYTKMQSELKVDNLGTVTLNEGPQDLKVIDLTASPYSHGIRCVLITLQSMSLTGTTTVTVKGNTAANGGGTDTTIYTATIASTETEFALEVPSEVIGHFSDRASDGYFLSLVIEIDGDDAGSGTDTVDACIVTKALREQDGLTPEGTFTLA